jgi:hypothetical protein
VGAERIGVRPLTDFYPYRDTAALFNLGNCFRRDFFESKTLRKITGRFIIYEKVVKQNNAPWIYVAIFDTLQDETNCA